MSKNEVNKGADECLSYIINTAQNIFKPIKIERKKQNMENENKNNLVNYEIYNLNQEQILALQIRRRAIDTKNNGKQYVFDVLMNLPVYRNVKDESGLVVKENLGKLNRWVSLHFRKDAFDNVPQECKIHKVDDLATGTLFVNAKSVKKPNEFYPHYEYKDTKDLSKWTQEERQAYDNDGTIPQVYVRPKCWIHKDGIVGFIPYTPTQDDFTYKTNDVDSSSLEESNEESNDNDSPF